MRDAPFLQRVLARTELHHFHQTAVSSGCNCLGKRGNMSTLAGSGSGRTPSGGSKRKNYTSPELEVDIIETIPVDNQIDTPRSPTPRTVPTEPGLSPSSSLQLSSDQQKPSLKQSPKNNRKMKERERRRQNRNQAIKGSYLVSGRSKQSLKKMNTNGEEHRTRKKLKN